MQTSQPQHDTYVYSKILHKLTDDQAAQVSFRRVLACVLSLSPCTQRPCLPLAPCPSQKKRDKTRQRKTVTHPFSDGRIVLDLFLHVDVEGVPVSSLGVLDQGPELLLEVVEVLEVAHSNAVADDLGRVGRSDALR